MMVQQAIHRATRWSTALSSTVNLHHAIDFRALCRANSVTSPSDVRGIETLELHRIYLTESAYKVVLQKLIPVQIRQLIIYISNDKGGAQAEEKEEMEEDRMAARKRKAEIAAGETPGPNFIRTSIYDKYVSGDLRSVIEITTNLDCPVT